MPPPLVMTRVRRFQTSLQATGSRIALNRTGTQRPEDIPLLPRLAIAQEAVSVPVRPNWRQEVNRQRIAEMVWRMPGRKPLRRSRAAVGGSVGGSLWSKVVNKVASGKWVVSSEYVERLAN